MINSKVHGYIDYAMGILLLLFPLLFELPEGAATALPLVLGAGTIIYSLITDYELGAVNVIPLKIHLIIDIIAGVLLAAAPWLFDFADVVYLPFLIAGILELIVALCTSKKRRYPAAPTP